MPGPTAYRLGDGAPVTADAAGAIWTAVAREVLEETAVTARVSHSELARQVQQRSGVYTRAPASEWLPGVVAALGDAGLLARLRPDAAPSAPRARVKSPRPPRAEPPPRKRVEAAPAICPSCFTQLPVSGRCDTCG